MVTLPKDQYSVFQLINLTCRETDWLRPCLRSGNILLLPCIIYFLAYAGPFEGKTSYINFVLYEKYYFF